MEKMMELDMEQMEEAVGGKDPYGGYEKKPIEKAGFMIYRIQSGDALGRIARKHKTTVENIMAADPSIINPNRIMAGYFIYIPIA